MNEFTEKLSLDESLINLTQNSINKRENLLPLLIVLIDDGTAAFITQSKSIGKFSEFLRKNQFYFFIVSPKTERFHLTNLLTRLYFLD